MLRRMWRNNAERIRQQINEQVDPVHDISRRTRIYTWHCFPAMKMLIYSLNIAATEVDMDKGHRGCLQTMLPRCLGMLWTRHQGLGWSWINCNRLSINAGRQWHSWDPDCAEYLYRVCLRRVVMINIKTR